MSNLSKAALAVLALSATLAPALAAASPAVHVNARQERQSARIERGADSGALTRAETRRLERSASGIAALEARMRADDGVLGPRERARLDTALDAQSRAIRLQATDAQSRP